VGIHALGRFRMCRHEIRSWRDGVIADTIDPATRVVRVSDDPEIAERIVASVPSVPRPVWGRDTFRTGDMWNSNSGERLSRSPIRVVPNAQAVHVHSIWGDLLWTWGPSTA
jgi:hypothetical protein